MKTQRVLDAFRFLLIAVSGWMNQHQLQIIDYLREENRVLREQLGGGRVRLDDNQRRRLAVKAKALGRKVLAEVATLSRRGTFVWRLAVIHPADNVRCPILVGAKLGLHPLVLFVAFVGGLIAFGPAGLILGPCVIAILLAVAETWRCPSSGAPLGDGYNNADH